MPNESFETADLVPVMMTLQTEPKEHKVPTNAAELCAQFIINIHNNPGHLTM